MVTIRVTYTSVRGLVDIRCSLISIWLGVGGFKNQRSANVAAKTSMFKIRPCWLSSSSLVDRAANDNLPQIMKLVRLASTDADE
jgi:hypothetical protein